MKMKMFKKAMALLFVIAVMIGNCCFSSVTANESFEDGITILESAPQTFPININDNFDDESFLVLIRPEYSGVNSIWDNNDFLCTNIDTVTDLTSVSNSFAPTLAQNEDFCQIVQVQLTVPGKQNVINAIEEIESDSTVLCAIPNYYMECNLEPDDPFYNFMTPSPKALYNRIGVEDAWDITTGSNNVKVGIIDSGIYNHTDLEANLCTGYDFYNNNTITTDDTSGHGTHVAGIIGAIGNNGQGVAGVNAAVSLIPLQAHLFGGFLDTSSIVRAII